MLVRPYRRKGFFIKDRDYNRYDTLATVEKLQKSVDKGDMLSEEQIIALRANMNPDNENVYAASRKLRRLRKKGK